MARTISGNNTSSVTLASGDNPVSITGTINITSGSAAAALYGPATGAPWSITNSGTVTTSLLGANGVTLAGGSIVNAASATISSTYTGGSGDAVIIGTGSAGGVGSVDNSGVLSNSNSSAGTAFAIELDSSGTIVNEAGGTIQGILSGAGIRNDAGNAALESVSNLGSIIGSAGTAATAGYGVAVTDGLVSNGATGVITNFWHGVDLFGIATLTNAGHITADTGVNLRASDLVTNAATGVILGTNGAGIAAAAGGVTVTNAGTISGSGSYDAILFSAPGSRVIADPGGVFNGLVNGGGGVLEMASGSDTVSSAFNFGTIVFDAGATALVAGTPSGLTGSTVNGFSKGDTIQFTGASETISSLTAGTLTLTGAYTISLVVGTGFPQTDYSTAFVGGNTDLTVACFGAGTRVLTTAGEVAVQALQPGMQVVSLAHGRTLPVTWVGVRSIDCAHHPEPERVWPVRIAADAFAPRVPHRPLLVSPDHAVWVDGGLVPVRHLCNGSSIAQVACDEVTYYHVELAAHGVLLAEGLAAESYLDTGNRTVFANAGEVAELHARFALHLPPMPAAALPATGAPAPASAASAAA